MRCDRTVKSIASIGVVAAACLCQAVAQEQPGIILGVLEDTPGMFYGESHYRSVRVVFHRDGTEWKAFPDDCQDSDCLKASASKFPAEMRWMIAFDGRSVGTVTSHTPDRFDFYSSVGQQRIANVSSVPIVGKPSREFAGWLSSAVYRPLIANSKPYFSDPEGWKTKSVAL